MSKIHDYVYVVIGHTIASTVFVELFPHKAWAVKYAVKLLKEYPEYNPRTHEGRARLAEAKNKFANYYRVPYNSCFENSERDIWLRLSREQIHKKENKDE